MFQSMIQVETKGQGLYDITSKIERAISGHIPEGGLLNIFVQHTSCSLLIQENADPSARKDLESFLDILIPENQPWHTHTFEGSDDTTAHLKTSITATSLNIPILHHSLALGTWQGIYLWEHRRATHIRRIVITIL